MSDPALPFTVLVDDNYHAMDESARYTLGHYPTLVDATQAARTIVDEFLASAYTAGMTAADLMANYVMFGEDPFIVSRDPAFGGVLFSAREYARWKSDVMCRTP